MIPRALAALRDAIKSGEPARIAACFTDDFLCERPLRPKQGFIGAERVAANWTAILTGLPDLEAEILRHAVDGDELWSEWEMRGTAPTGATALLRGPVVVTTRDDRIAWARFYLDPVDTDGPTHSTVSATVEAPAEQIFELLREPGRHPEFDATGFLRHAENPRRIEAVGDVFGMAMHNDEHGDYRIENLVVAFTENRLIGWAPGRPGERPAGHRFTWALSPDGERTEVTLTYDWTAVTHPGGVPRMPVLSVEDLESSLRLLARAAS